jgi:ribosome-binding protein aMBF1 (putative translation factor)
MVKVTSGANELRSKVDPPKAMSMRELARRIGVSPQAVVAWVHGVSQPTEENQRKMEELLGIDVSKWKVDSETAEA